MNTKQILLTILTLAVLGLIISYTIKSPEVNYDVIEPISVVEEIEINEEYIESEIDAVIDQENIINQEIDELEASF
jgi:hypothetical protein